MDRAYWQKQSTDKPLFPDIEWSKPEQRSMAGKLAIIGGNKGGFLAISDNYTFAQKIGIGQIKVLLPDSLKGIIPINPDMIFSASTKSGGLSQDAKPEFQEIARWSDGILLIGDAGKSSETSILYEQFIENTDKLVVITRDAVDLFSNFSSILDKPNVTLVISMAQLQKIFQNVYYPIIIALSMQLTNLVEALHKFTVTYSCTIVVFHQENIVVANQGRVSTTPNQSAMQLWRGHTATKAIVYWIWTSNKPFESIATSLVN